MRIAFRLDGEFEQALLYTTDVWLRDEDAGNDAPMGASQALGNGPGPVGEAMSRPLSPPPWESVSASIAAPERGVLTDLVLGHPGIYSNLLELQHTIMYFITLQYHLTRANAGLSS
jgi:hypothetical protein